MRAIHIDTYPLDNIRISTHITYTDGAFINHLLAMSNNLHNDPDSSYFKRPACLTNSTLCLSVASVSINTQIFQMPMGLTCHVIPIINLTYIT